MRSVRWSPVALLVVFGAFLLHACGGAEPSGSPQVLTLDTTTTSTSTTQPATTTTTRATTTSTWAAAPEDVYIYFLRDWSWDQSYWTLIDASSDDELLGLGYAACDALDSGASFEELAAVTVAAVDYDADYIQGAGTIIGAAVFSFCPHHGAALDEWVNTL